MPKTRFVLLSMLSLLVPLLVAGASPSGAVAPDAGAARAVKQVGSLGWSSDARAAPAEVTWTAAFTPARPGRKVVFSEKRGARFVRVAVVRQDRRGVAVFRTTYPRTGEHRLRAVAKAVRGLGPRSTPAVTATLE